METPLHRIIYLQYICTETLKEIKGQKAKTAFCACSEYNFKEGGGSKWSFKKQTKNKQFNPRLEIYSNVEPTCHHCQNTEKETEREIEREKNIHKDKC